MNPTTPHHGYLASGWKLPSGAGLVNACIRTSMPPKLKAQTPVIVLKSVVGVGVAKPNPKNL
jgi:hypothetical protein